MPMAWLWSRFKGIFAQSAGERRALAESPAPMAWVWSAYRGEFPQSDAESRALAAAPAPMAWVWSAYKGEFPQNAEEKQILLERLSAPSPMTQDQSPEPESPAGATAAKAMEEAPLADGATEPASHESRAYEPGLAEAPGPGSSSDEEKSGLGEQAPAKPSEPGKGGDGGVPWRVAAAGALLLVLGLGAIEKFGSSDRAGNSPPPAPTATAEQGGAPGAETAASSGAPRADAAASAQGRAAAPAEAISPTAVAQIPPPGAAPEVAAAEIGAENATPQAGGASAAAAVAGPGATLAMETKLQRFLQTAATKSGDFDLDGAAFEGASAALSVHSSKQLGNVAEILKAFPNAAIAVNAYAPAHAGKKPNLRLPWEQANAVLRELARNGVDKTRMTTRIFKNPRSGSEDQRQTSPHISLTITRP